VGVGGAADLSVLKHLIYGTFGHNYTVLNDVECRRIHKMQRLALSLRHNHDSGDKEILSSRYETSGGLAALKCFCYMAYWHCLGNNNNNNK